MYKCLRMHFNEINALNFARVSHKLCFTSEIVDYNNEICCNAVFRGKNNIYI